ncbi:putative bactoprenol glucosyl transferase-like protein [Desulfitobacterium hafniense DP7]|uniref:Putative bactoprenol glucosyl transferase-like protein n=1 Tax=Desulfitobacterium hafniense DP7 TaxID=537010 RepID=G9XVV6_DESHA|nr:putative bactoprenol glucosyl transferase-like protein [Desulfitobacterium hafniense DP7]
MLKLKTIYLVIPCYNEEAVLPESAKQIRHIMTNLIEAGKITSASRVCFVNDGSKDNTWEIIEQLNQESSLFSGINLAHNKGHQNALLAGLLTVKDYCDAAISLDADLQDDVTVVEKFIDKFYEGCDIVYGVRSSRKRDSFFKRTSAQVYYKLMHSMGVDIISDHADYRLMSKRALESLAKFKEVNLFLRGIIPMIGYKTGYVEYERYERFAGVSKYPLKKMISFGLEGITSLSIRPIRLITMLGLGIFLISIAMLIYFLAIHYLGSTVPGWTTIVISIWAIGGLQLLAIGVIGEYIGKIYLESKGRPRFIIERFLNTTEEDRENAQ